MADKKRLIYADTLWTALDEAGLFASGNPRHIAQQTVEEQPTVDAVEVVHGQWVSDKAAILFRCSVCETQISTDWDYDDLIWNYCPNCGAKMDLEAS